MLAFWAAAPPLTAQRWRVQYFYDEDKSTLVISDLQFPSATRGVAVGAIMEGKSRKPVALVTSDGGAHFGFGKQESYLRSDSHPVFNRISGLRIHSYVSHGNFLSRARSK